METYYILNSKKNDLLKQNLNNIRWYYCNKEISHITNEIIQDEWNELN